MAQIFKSLIGETLEFSWPITTSGQIIPLEGRNLSLVLVGPDNVEIPLDYTIEHTNVVCFTYEGANQSVPGIYTATLYENRGEENQAVVDQDAFELVETIDLFNWGNNTSLWSVTKHESKEDGGVNTLVLRFSNRKTLELHTVNGSKGTGSYDAITDEEIDAMFSDESSDQPTVLRFASQDGLRRFLNKLKTMFVDGLGVSGDALTWTVGNRVLHITVPFATKAVKDANGNDIHSTYATKNEVNAKQGTIDDLEEIRRGARLGATSIQEHQDISGKQDNIADLEEIRRGAALGATSIQQHQDISGKQDKLVSGSNIKTVNGQTLLGEGDIVIIGEQGVPGEKGDPFTYEDLTDPQKAEIAKDATAAAQQAAASAQDAANSASAAEQKVTIIDNAIKSLDPSQSTDDAVVALAAKQGAMEADLTALGPKINQNTLYRRGIARPLYSSGYLNFDNTNHRVEVPGFIFPNPLVSNSRIDVSAQTLDYTFSSAMTSAYSLVYNLETQEVTFQPITNNTAITNLMVILAFISIQGAGTTNGLVNKINYSAFADARINGVNQTTRIEALETSFSGLNNKYKGVTRTIDSASINFNNTTHQAELSGVRISSHTNNNRVSIAATNVDYNFNSDATTAVWLVYDTTQSAYAFISAGTNNYNQIPIAALRISGKSSADPNTSKVDEVYWCPIEHWSIDGKNLGTEVKGVDDKINEIHGIFSISKETASITLAVGSIYHGANNTSNTALRSANFIPVLGGSIVEVIHASDINVRVSQYDANKTYIKEDGYGNLTSISLDYNARFVRIAAAYSSRGYSDSNPVTVDAFQTGDFGLRTTSMDYGKWLTDVKMTDFVDDGNWFVDSNKWVESTGQYHVRVIPVVGGTKIRATANSVMNTRIAFLNTYDPSTRVNNQVIDGIGNQGTAKGATRVYDVPATCTYIAVSSIYGGINALPTSLIIDGKEYMKPLAPESIEDAKRDIVNLTQKVDGYDSAIEGVNKGTLTDILGRNIHKDAAVRATGKKAISATDILPLSFIHVSDIHTKSNNYKCFENACEFYEHYSNIKFMIATGDLVYDDFSDLMTWYDLALQKTTKPVYNVIGNHDAGQQEAGNPSLDRVCTDLQCYNRYIAPYVEDWGVVQPSDAATEGKSYYYKDFTDEKVRLIVLNEFETDYELSETAPTTSLKYSREFRAMRQAQVTWLISTLGSTPSDYGVIVAYHQPDTLADADNAFVSFDLLGSYRSSHGSNANIANVYCDDKLWLPKILNAFATKSSLELTVTQTGGVTTSSPTLVCDCDFTNVEAEFICILNGHTHRDYIGYISNYPALKVLCVGADNLLYTSGFQPRAENTPSEDLFNVVNIDRNRKTIKVIRIGSDASVTGQVRDQMIMSYGS